MTKEEFEMMTLEERVYWLYEACAEMQRHVKAVEKGMQTMRQHTVGGNWLADVLDDIGHANDVALKERDEREAPQE